MTSEQKISELQSTLMLVLGFLMGRDEKLIAETVARTLKKTGVENPYVDYVLGIEEPTPQIGTPGYIDDEKGNRDVDL